MGVETIAIASLAATVIGAGVGAVGAIQSSQAQSAAASYQAQVAQNNAITQQQNAAYERQKTAVEAQTQDQKNKAQLGLIGAAQSANGFDLGSKSLVDTRASAAELGRLDTLTTSNNGERKAQAYDQAAVNANASAGMYDMTASNSASAGGLTAFSTLLTGATGFGDRWSSFKKAGAL
jgi:hypothetical protein